MQGAAATPEVGGDGAEAPARRLYVTAEYDPISIPFDHLVINGRLRVYDEIVGKGYFSVYVSRNQIVFQAGGYVGLIPINERVAIDVRPRVPLASIERLLRIANASPVTIKRELRAYASDTDPLPSLLDVLTDSFIDAVDLILANGLHREYRHVSGDTSYPRGRIVMGDTLRRHISRGVGHKVGASWFEQTTDTGPNRCIRFVLLHLARCYTSLPQGGESRARLRALNRQHHAFERAELDLSRRFLDDPLVRQPSRMPSVRAYYERALHLARTILQEQGITFDGRDAEIIIPSLLVNLEMVFESYVRSVVRAQLAGLAPDVLVLDGNTSPPSGGSRLLFDTPMALETVVGAPENGRLPKCPPATPDIVLRCQTPDHADATPMVIEVKYKRIRESPARDDLNQAITYASAYGASVALVVHPLIEGGRRGLTLLGKVGSALVYQYGIDLAASPLVDEEELLARQIVRLLPSRSN